MRVCLFHHSLAALLDGSLAERVRARLGERDLEIVNVTSSWADIPEGSSVHATRGARTLSMRIYRSLTSARPIAAAGERLLMPFVGPLLLEAFRAADADLIVCATRAEAASTRRLLRRANAPWPCVSVDEVSAFEVRAFRRYDPAVKVSIVLPTYNGGRYLRESIASCLDQTHRNLELVIVDDGSCVSVEGVARDFNDPRVKVIRHDRNQGLPRSLNTGFAHTTGELCTWTSDDNTYLPSAIEDMVRMLHTYPDVDFVYAESYRVDEQGRVGVPAVMRVRPPDSLTDDNYIGACFLYRRAVYQAIGDYNPEAELAEDYDYWVRVARRFTMQPLFRPLYRYRFHGASLTSSHDRRKVARRVDVIRQQFRRERRAWSR
jgi:GT2 family glycosyltransferase